jgi:hypothetical protein
MHGTTKVNQHDELSRSLMCDSSTDLSIFELEALQDVL